jgi:formimidoylglutamate deiminase
MTTTLFAPTALLPEGWVRGVRVSLDGSRIAAVETEVPRQAGDRGLDGCALLPAIPNLHSHTFQRAMVGMTGQRIGREDSFWSWRDTMYRFVEGLDPDDVEAIAAQAFMEMLEGGYGSVAEFHYLHHAPGGVPYDDPAELSRRIVSAAATTGIGLTLLPVLYTSSGADGSPLAGAQRRFGHEVEGFLRLVGAVGPYLPADGTLGAAPHSLRAVTLGQMTALVEALPHGPLHIHAAEQRREVEEVEARLGAPPVRLLLDRVGIGPRWCVIHATHLGEGEVAGLARSGAVAGLCPTTEADLGDGIFEGAAYLAAGGRFGIGSDSNLRIAPAEELRLLEYGQRLREGRRNVLAAPGGWVGETLYLASLQGGAQALGRECGAIRPGALADLMAIRRDGDRLGSLSDAQLLDGWIFGGSDRSVRELWSAGRHVVREGRHVARDTVSEQYRARMRRVLERMGEAPGRWARADGPASEARYPTDPAPGPAS